MAFSPFARFRNFTVDNLKALLEVYPDQARKLSWSEAGDIVESVSSGYKKTSYQQACQFGLEDRGSSSFRVQSYLYTFDDENLKRYLEFWIKTYYAPNPYVNSDDEPVLIFVELAKEILAAPNLRMDYYDFFNRRIGGKSDDILLNALKNYAKPLRYEKVGENHYFYVSEVDKGALENIVSFICDEFSISDAKNRKVFFDRYTYSNFCKFYGIEQSELQEHSGDVKDEEQYRVIGGTNILCYGVPGSGKSYAINKICSDETYMERVVFHPDYSYSDFVGQILPRLTGGKMTYEFVAGPFTNIFNKAVHDPSHMYYLVIEEINRGNAPAIFGEIFQLLDRKEISKVGESEYSIVNYDIADYVYGDTNERIRIPSNLTLLATMNTSDQNVFTLDTAFQRRWDMRHIPNKFTDAHAQDIIDGTEISWGVFAGVVNDLVIEMNSDMTGSGDKRLGAYFAKTRELKKGVFPEKVLKYLWDDAFRMDKQVVFDKRHTSLEKVLETYQTALGDPLKSVLKGDVYQKMVDGMRNSGIGVQVEPAMEADEKSEEM